MEQTLHALYQSLQKLVGLHRKLLDSIRLEREALIAAEIKTIQDCTYSKEALIHSVQVEEKERLKIIAELALILKKPVQKLTLSQVIIEVQGVLPKTADQLRSVLNTLTVLIQRITEQNAMNKNLVHKTLEHINAMKKNVLGEAASQSQTYTQQGQKSHPQNSPRLISREA